MKTYMHFSYPRTIRPKQENFFCNNKTNYTRGHKFITHKLASKSSQEAVMTSQCS